MSIGFLLAAYFRYRFEIPRPRVLVWSSYECRLVAAAAAVARIEKIPSLHADAEEIRVSQHRFGAGRRNEFIVLSKLVLVYWWPSWKHTSSPWFRLLVVGLLSVWTRGVSRGDIHRRYNVGWQRRLPCRWRDTFKFWFREIFSLGGFLSVLGPTFAFGDSVDK